MDLRPLITKVLGWMSLVTLSFEFANPILFTITTHSVRVTANVLKMIGIRDLNIARYIAYIAPFVLTAIFAIGIILIMSIIDSPDFRLRLATAYKFILAYSAFCMVQTVIGTFIYPPRYTNRYVKLNSGFIFIGLAACSLYSLYKIMNYTGKFKTVKLFNALPFLTLFFMYAGSGFTVISFSNTLAFVSATLHAVPYLFIIFIEIFYIPKYMKVNRLNYGYRAK